jgi:hypothetical protein
MHAANVLGAGLDAHQNRRLVLGGGGLGGLGGEDDAPGGRAGAGGQPAGEDVARGGGIDLRMQVLDQAARLDAEQRLGPVDGATIGQIDDDANAGAAGAFDEAGFEDGDGAVLDRETDAVGVAETGGGARGSVAQRGKRGGGKLFQRGQVLAGLPPRRAG